MADGGLLEVRPSPTQERVMRSPAREVLFGGAAGGGKSHCLILGALDRIDNPHYNALLLRRAFTDLEESFVEKSRELYTAMGGKYDGSLWKWRFPSRARIGYGYLSHSQDRERYKGNEYQLIEWDELTTFKREQDYEFVNSRLRSPKGLTGYIRAGSNPGDIGHDWVFRRWAPWLWQPGIAPYPGATTEEGEIPRPKSGEILWFRKSEDGTELVTKRRWHDPKCIRCAPKEPCAMHAPLSRTFIPSFVTDNKYLAGTEYEATLFNLPPLERARMLNGDWNIVPAAGMYFKRAAFGEPLPSIPTNAIARVRYWDRAATEGGGDWTVGVRMSVLPGPTFVVEDVVRVQKGPGGVMATIKETAEADAPYGTIVALEQDPAQAGKVEVYTYSQWLAGHPLVALHTQGSKLTRARPVSSQVYLNNVRICRGPWNNAYLTVLEGFTGAKEGEVDDDVDATSGAFRVCLDEYERLQSHTNGLAVARVTSG